MRTNKDRAVSALIVVCILAIIACGVYLFYNYFYLPREINARNAEYAALYSPVETYVPTAHPTQAPVYTIPPTPAPSPSPLVTLIPAESPSPAPASDNNEPTDILLGTPGPDTIMYLAPTLPPVQESFSDLLAFNPETVAFLRVRDIALPVVQRENDNEFYLSHDFEGNESPAGCLFLDGVNRLQSGDKCLFVYGHNMKNGAMFGNLTDFSRASVIKENPVVRFDTIYRDGAYVPFACFELTANRESSNYFQLRTFAFTDEAFDEYITELKKRSLIDIPVDVNSSDELLILITCNYSIDDGRFVLACRRLRDGETESSVRAIVGQSTEK